MDIPVDVMKSVEKQEKDKRKRVIKLEKEEWDVISNHFKKNK